ncbi:hypothetical protein DSLASN_14310 [Desulfoluna limicola]|uniref:Uncharacterized protein n=1 Tax=Desulfoluna limicola TaxID=2810562 RepID=A0ABN6F439_9BACT|nr:hypothetical protein DSLASN_14310 [Desulfoluna limicola]
MSNINETRIATGYHRKAFSWAYREKGFSRHPIRANDDFLTKGEVLVTEAATNAIPGASFHNPINLLNGSTAWTTSHLFQINST